MRIRPAAAALALAPLLAPAALGQHTARFASGAVAADHALASRAGAQMLEAGGNAVDAAVAASFALSVVDPYACGIGGGGFMVIHLDRHPRLGTVDVVLNYREQAPAWATAQAVEAALAEDPKASTRGGRAVAVPGTVAGLLHALSTYGTLPREKVLAPAIRLAEQGAPADEAFLRAIRGEVLPSVAKDPALKARFPFVWDRLARGGAVALGDVIELPEQARVLRAIADQGEPGFYTGPTAERITAATSVGGAGLTAQDLAAFKVRTMTPLEVPWRGLRVVTMPPPSSGGLALAQVLLTLGSRPEPLEALGHDSPAYSHLLAEALKHAFADRARWLADPDFTPLPIDRLLDPAMLRARAASISPDRTLDLDRYGWPGPAAPAAAPPEDHGTSHLSVVDRWGNAVACTETINLEFGSWVDGGGFCLNNQMDDFQTQRGAPNAFGLTQSDANRPAPGKRPLSSMTPTIVLATTETGPRVRLVVGAAGGPRIISGTVQALLNQVVFGMPAGEAVGAWRVHHQWKPDELLLEGRGQTPPQLGIELGRRGHKVVAKPETWGVGVVQMVVVDPVTGEMEAACDPRRGGSPAGLGPR